MIAVLLAEVACDEQRRVPTCGRAIREALALGLIARQEHPERPFVLTEIGRIVVSQINQKGLT